jgi:predicted phage-related endonuclease
MLRNAVQVEKSVNRRSFIGGSDARIIIGSDETALVRLWREKRGEVEPEDLSGNLIVQLGTVTEDLNRRWYELNSGDVIKDVQKRAQHQVIRWMAATLDGVVESTGAVFEAKFMLPWSFSEELAAEKHMAQLQHNMWVIQSRSAVLSIITGGGKWVENICIWRSTTTPAWLTRKSCPTKNVAPACAFSLTRCASSGPTALRFSAS